MSYLLGSHNSFSYIKPVKWYMRPFHFIGKCQSKDLNEQYELGVRVFDLRVVWYNEEWYVAHGSMIFNAKAYDLLDKLEEFDDIIYVRVILEYNKECDEEVKERFIAFCTYISNKYNFIFFEGVYKYDWTVLYTFDNSFTIEHKYSSNTSLFKNKSYNSFLGRIDDWFPLIYAKLNNKANYEEGTDKDILLMDFVQIGLT